MSETRTVALSFMTMTMTMTDEHRQRSGQVVRLNDKTVTLNADGQKWRVAYDLLHRVLNSSNKQTINGELI